MDDDVLCLGDGTGCQHEADAALGLGAVVFLEGFRGGAAVLAVLLEGDAAAGEALFQQLHLILGGAVENFGGQVYGHIGTGHVQQLLAGGAVSPFFVDLLLFGAKVSLQRIEGVEAQTLGESLIRCGRDFLGQRAELDLELCGLAGQLRQAEVLRVSKVEAEHLAGTVAVDGLLGGGHQLTVAQHDHDLLHPAVGDLLAVHVAGKVQQSAEAAPGRFGGGVVDRVHPGLVDKLDVHSLVGDRADVTGDSQALVLAQLHFRRILLIHSGVLLMT